MEREVNEGGGGTCVTLLAMQKTSLSMCFPYINYKKRKGAFLASMHRVHLVISKKKKNTWLSLSYITVIITTFL